MRVNLLEDIISNSISATVELEPNDYLEIWEQKLVGFFFFFFAFFFNNCFFFKP